MLKYAKTEENKINLSMNIKISSNRSFGIVFFVVFLIVALWPLKNNLDIRIWSLIISFIFLILGIFNSKLLSPLNKIWFKFGILLGRIISPIVMGIIFFIVVTPTAIILKIFRKDVLSLKKSNSNSYWKKKADYKTSMKNQF
mgnify:CR=1 FL=1|tara:strand:- start:77 stop:502 length:426 start_codon:yes stop_codon:yes gene_type:complete